MIRQKIERSFTIADWPLPDLMLLRILTMMELRKHRPYLHKKRKGQIEDIREEKMDRHNKLRRAHWAARTNLNLKTVYLKIIADIRCANAVKESSREAFLGTLYTINALFTQHLAWLETLFSDVGRNVGCSTPVHPPSRCIFIFPCYVRLGHSFVVILIISHHIEISFRVYLR